MEDDEALIEAVRGYECLWKVKSKGYKDLRAKENAWKVVAEKVKDSTPEDCQRRWKSLRDKYVRELKKTKKGKSGDEGPPSVSCWPLFEVMGFIEDTICHRPTTTNYRKRSLPSSSEVSLTSEEPSNEDVDNEDTHAELLSEHSESSGSVGMHSSSESSHRTSCPGSRESSEVPQEVQKIASKRYKKKSRELDDVEKAILSKLRDEDCDAEEHFGLHVASILRGLPPRERAFTKIEIDRLLFAAQFPEMRSPRPSAGSYPLYPSTSYLPSTPTSNPPTNYQSHPSPDPFNY